MNEIQLSTKQREIVDFHLGPILVTASAGSGKTRVLTERIKKLLSLTKRKILAITFTNKAGEEMLSRLEDIPNIRERLFVGTFHGFCQNVLENHGTKIGLQKLPHIFEDDSERLELLEEAILSVPSFESSYLSKGPKDRRNYIYNILRYISEVKRNLKSAYDTPNEDYHEDSFLLYRAYQDILNSQNGIDFDDLILLTYNLFALNEDVCALYRRMYDFVCIDEAQDLNYAQYNLVKILMGNTNRNLMMVGDPNQSIFAFNGSSSEFMNTTFVRDFNASIIDLNENYRSSIKVLEAADKIISKSGYISNTVKTGEFLLLELENEKDESDWIIEKINELTSIGIHPDIEGTITHEKIAVLARNKYILLNLENNLKEHNLPFYYKITPGAIKFESDLMKVFDLALKVKINPQDSLHFNKLKDNLGLSFCQDLEELVLNSKGNYRNVFEFVLNLIDDGSNFKTTLRKILESIENDNWVLNDNERFLVHNDVKELSNHWYNYAVKTERKSLAQFKNSMALGKTHPLANKNGITLSSVHTMKGQEYDIVFIIGCDDETFPDYRAVSKGGVQLRQELNNMYVAFTRSKRFLYVTYPRKRIMPWGDVKIRRRSRFLNKFELST